MFINADNCSTAVDHVVHSSFCNPAVSVIGIERFFSRFFYETKIFDTEQLETKIFSLDFGRGLRALCIF